MFSYNNLKQLEVNNLQVIHTLYICMWAKNHSLKAFYKCGKNMCRSNEIYSQIHLNSVTLRVLFQQYKIVAAIKILSLFYPAFQKEKHPNTYYKFINSVKTDKTHIFIYKRHIFKFPNIALKAIYKNLRLKRLRFLKR